ncbi:hypothetical protein AVEN_149404-1 [Araneus ventricosus]|uniref:LRP2-binding protein n=1 Tax=Araneus ventricosus TaxID=182803 RepID=A0A4Y2JLT0_ARAVE|nr:hypothetical protein AVEN_149404-1 [Araneus ventricosus]
MFQPRGVSYLQKLVNTDDIRPGEEGVLAIALFYMGELYYKGIVVPKDNELAEKYWLRGAMIQKNPVTGLYHYGSVECQTALGMFYSNREFLDLKKAFQWHKRAQESGSVVSEVWINISSWSCPCVNQLIKFLQTSDNK